MTTIFDKHPRPWSVTMANEWPMVVDADGDFTGIFEMGSDDVEDANSILAAVNAEPALRARIAELEAALQSARADVMQAVAVLEREPRAAGPLWATTRLLGHVVSNLNQVVDGGTK